MRFLWLALGFVLLSPPAQCQSAPACPAAETMQALLAEVRQLRQDFHSVSIAARRGQILIYRLYVQEAVVAHASEQLNQAKMALEAMQQQVVYSNTEVQNYEQMRDKAENAAERKRFEELITNAKDRQARDNLMEQEVQTKETEFEDEWRMEQAKLDQLHAQLDRLDSELESAALQSASRKTGAQENTTR